MRKIRGAFGCGLMLVSMILARLFSLWRAVFVFAGLVNTATIFHMCNWRTLVKRSEAVSVALIIALVFLSILPAHFHLHFVEGTGVAGATSDSAAHSHEHVVDLHVYNSSENSAHPFSHHDDAQIIKTSPDVRLKNLDFKFSPFLIFVSLLAFAILALGYSAPRPARRISANFQNNYHRSPPLRGPPHLN